MRRIRVQDAWRRITKGSNQWEFTVSRLGYDTISGLGSGEIAFNSQISVLAGPNGVGKTTLLKAMWAAADPVEAELGYSARLKFSSGRAVLQCIRNSAQISSEVEFSAGEVRSGNKIPFDCFHLDPWVPQLKQGGFCSFNSLDDIINGMSVQTADAAVLEEINYISRRDYREVKIYEVDDGDDITPFFEVAYGDDRYDTRTMGAGELSSLFLWWAVDRAPDNSLILIEEPETYMSPAAQAAFTDFIVVSTSKKFLNVIMTSHSPSVFQRLPESSLICLYRERGKTKVASAPVPAEWWRSVGIEPHVSLIMIVEDLLGELLLRHMLESHDPLLSRRLEIQQKAGQGDMVTMLRSIKEQFKAIKIIGAFDGDQRDKIPEGVEKFSVFLPGTQPIEAQFRDVLRNDHSPLEKVIDNQNTGTILSSLEGLDIHDWFSGLSESLGRSQEQMFTILYPIWEKYLNNKESVQEVIADITSCLTVSEKH